MEFSSNQLEIKENPELGLNCLHFKFKGKFTEETSIQGTQAWAKEFEANPDTQYCMLWDCSQMTGFEPAARKEWYLHMTKYKDRIKEVNVVAKNLIIRGAAKVMLEFFGLKSRVVRSMDELLVKA